MSVTGFRKVGPVFFRIPNKFFEHESAPVHTERSGKEWLEEGADVNLDLSVFACYPVWPPLLANSLLCHSFSHGLVGDRVVNNVGVKLTGVTQLDNIEPCFIARSLEGLPLHTIDIQCRAPPL